MPRMAWMIAATLALSPVLITTANGQIGLFDGPGVTGGSPTSSSSDPNQLAAEQAYQQGNFQKCLDIANSMLAQNPNSDVAIYLRGSSRVELGIQKRDLDMIRSGIEDSRNALRIGGVDKVNYYLPYMYGMVALANIEGKKEHAEVVTKFADSILARPNLKPDEKANIYYQKGGADVALKRLDAAIGDYLSAIQSAPQHLGAHMALAETYAATGKYKEADAAFANIVRQFPSNPLVFNNRGMYFQQQRRMKEAIADFTKALQLDPRFLMGYINRGFTYLNDGQSTLAINDFNEALKANPNQPMVYSLRAAAKLQMGKPAEAMVDYEQVLKMDPKNPVATADVGFAKFFAKDYAGALSSFNTAVLEEPNLRYLNPWRYLAMTFSGQQSAAAATFSDSLNRPADQRDWMDAIVLYLDGRMSEQELFNSADKNDINVRTQQFCEAYYFIGQKRLLSGDQAGANDFFQKSLDTQQRHLSGYRGSMYMLNKFAQ